MTSTNIIENPEKPKAAVAASKLDCALRWAAKGLPVFVLVPGLKDPFSGSSWTQDATTDRATIERWWGDEPNANIGVLCDGLIVVDVDAHRNGFAALPDLDLPTNTLCTKSPRGGHHYYFRAPAGRQFAGGTDKLAPGVDVKAFHGYVLAPGSFVNDPSSDPPCIGPYTLLNDAPVLEAPAHLVARLDAPRERDAAAQEPPPMGWDTPLALWLADAYLRDAPVAIEGSGGDNMTIKVACQLRDYGISEPKALELMQDLWDWRCSPPWDDGLAKKVANAYLYAKGRAGSDHPGANFAGVVVPPPETKPEDLPPDVAARMLERSLATVKELQSRQAKRTGGADEEGELEPFELINPADHYAKIIAPRRWIVPDWLPCGVVTGLYGDGGLGKSLLAQQLQSACSRGGEWIGQIADRCKSIGFYCEDDAEELLRRQERITAALSLTTADLENIRLVSRVDHDNTLMEFSKSGKGDLTRLHRQIMEQAQDFGARLVILDTAADFFAGNENDRRQVRQFIAVAAGKIARAIEGAVMICAHPSRAGMATGTGDGGNTAWNNTFRSRLYLKRPERKTTFCDGERVISREKSNYAPREEGVDLIWRNGVFSARRSNGSVQRLPADDVFLSILAKLFEQGRVVSESAHAGNHAPKEFAKHPDSQGYKAQDFKLAMERLFAAGKIKVAEDGPPSKLRRFITNA